MHSGVKPISRESRFGNLDKAARASSKTRASSSSSSTSIGSLVWPSPRSSISGCVWMIACRGIRLMTSSWLIVFQDLMCPSDGEMYTSLKSSLAAWSSNALQARRTCDRSFLLSTCLITLATSSGARRRMSKLCGDDMMEYAQ